MPLATNRVLFHWPDFDEDDVADVSTANGKTLCGIDSANEQVNFIFDSLYQKIVEQEVALDIDLADICDECENKVEWITVEGDEDEEDDSSS